MADKKSILVTGGTGFIGSVLVRRMVRDGYAVRVVDNDLRGSAVRLADVLDKIDLINCDVRDTAAMIAAAKGVDSIFHLSALNGTENFYKRPQLVLDVGIRGLLATLDAAQENKVTEFVLASSAEAYQTPPVTPTPEEVPLTIPDPWNPRYSYGGSKLISEIIVANYYRDLFKRMIVFRPHNVYGPDMGNEHVIPQLVLRAHEQIKKHPTGNVPFEIQGDGSQTRAFIYVDDAVDGLMTLLDRGSHRNTYHIGTGDELRISSLVEVIFKWFGRTPTIVPMPAPEGATPIRCPDTRKLRALGFSPKVTIDEGVARTAKWYVDHANKAS